VKSHIDSAFRRTTLIVAVLLVTLLAGHLYFWYWPRPRAGRPDSESVAGQLVLAHDGLPYRLWLPFPHQNLKALEQHLGSAGSLRQASVELAGFDIFKVPSFGPFRVPPSREILLATDEDRGRMLMVVRMYPVIRWVLRAAGRVAGNPWLAGGEIQLGDRDVEIRWVGGDWIASSAGLDLDVIAQDVVAMDLFAAFRTTESIGVVPGGLYALELDKSRLSVSSVTSRFPPKTAVSSFVGSTGVALVSAHFPPADVREGVNALALLVRTGSDAAQVPGAVIVHRGAEKRWNLPGERLLSVAGIQPVSVAREGWSVWAYDDASLSTGADLIPAIETMQRSARVEGISSAGEIDLGQARVAVQLIDSLIGAIPLVGRSEARLWARTSSILELFSDYSNLSYRIGESPDRLEMIIE
jgi:hypothetical protein